MNQILETNLKNKIKNKKDSKLLKFLFFISILFSIIIIISIIINKIINNSYSDKKSSEILSNYNMMRLYSSINNNTNSNSGNLNKYKENKFKNSSSIIGTIEIKKINLNYAIFSGFTEELLKTSPCRFFGPNIGEIGNLCIAGHNYDNDKFFSKIPKLKSGDEIILRNSDNIDFSYFVKNIYEVNSNDLSPIYEYDKNLKNLTLITCNNFTKNRIIVRAIAN